MAFGGGSFYKGSKNNNAWTQDLLWKLYVEKEAKQTGIENQGAREWSNGNFRTQRGEPEPSRGILDQPVEGLYDIISNRDHGRKTAKRNTEQPSDEFKQKQRKREQHIQKAKMRHELFLKQQMEKRMGLTEQIEQRIKTTQSKLAAKSQQTNRSGAGTARSTADRKNMATMRKLLNQPTIAEAGRQNLLSALRTERTRRAIDSGRPGSRARSSRGANSPLRSSGKTMMGKF